MSIWQRLFGSRGLREETDIRDRLRRLEDEVRHLNETLCHDRPSFVIHHADVIRIEKVDHSNHFGTVDIQTLSGRLNIGANYSGYWPTDGQAASEANEGDDRSRPATGERPTGASAPRCHIRTRPKPSS
ncbi:hypothetical protein [Cohnella sp. REN36]|uniref:hypothetical protein n=1 Tax=Cohnella sp. REN36 TaxID=2887347 RepID=UPI001D158828|nr:hypothetical protein [Cohnella sp. REN36]MCC3373297.1 hypothetical protein [Cohnella sp. REN36]